MLYFGDIVKFFKPKFNRYIVISSSQLPVKIFWISLPEVELQVIKAELCCDIWLDFAMVTVRNSAVCIIKYKDSIFALLQKANFKVASISVCANLAQT